MTSRGKRKPRYGFDEIVMPRRLPRSGTRCQADNAVFLERLAVGSDRLVEPRRAALAFPETLKREAEVVLRHRPVERHPLARPFLERLAVGSDRIIENVILTG